RSRNSVSTRQSRSNGRRALCADRDGYRCYSIEPKPAIGVDITLIFSGGSIRTVLSVIRRQPAFRKAANADVSGSPALRAPATRGSRSLGLVEKTFPAFNRETEVHPQHRRGFRPRDRPHSIPR